VAGLVGGLTSPMWAVAQTDRRPSRIGVLLMSDPDRRPAQADSFFRELVQRGLVEGPDLVIDRRFAYGDPTRLRRLADELVALRPDVIFTASGTLGALAAKAATSTIPIVFDASNDPVGRGLVADLARPGGNMTGSRVFGLQQDLKRLQMLVEVLKAPRCIAVLDMAPGAPSKPPFVAAFAKLGLDPRSRLSYIAAPRVEDLPGGFDQMQRERADGLVVALSPSSQASTERITALAAKYRLPAIADGRDFAEGGLLMAYSTPWDFIYRRGADYVSRILAGAKPADLPVEQASRFELVINLKTARLLGIQMPQSMLLLADAILE
jgi:putative ABC transport system substrate-binding protein